jgi:aconitate hydratase
MKVVVHSVQVDSYGKSDSLKTNLDLEMERNRERFFCCFVSFFMYFICYRFVFLKWGANAFRGLTIVPPGGKQQNPKKK